MQQIDTPLLGILSCDGSAFSVFREPNIMIRTYGSDECAWLIGVSVAHDFSFAPMSSARHLVGVIKKWFAGEPRFAGAQPWLRRSFTVLHATCRLEGEHVRQSVAHAPAKFDKRGAGTQASLVTQSLGFAAPATCEFPLTEEDVS